MNPELFARLTAAELAELDHFLTYEVDSDEVFMLDLLDGLLHAVVIGPITLSPSQWLPKLWGEEDSLVPPVASVEQLNRVMDLVMRHYNSIVAGFEADPPEMTPLWETRQYRGKTYEDGEGWAYGFLEGMRLCWDHWQPMLDSAEGKSWFRPIGLLAENEFSPDQDELVKTPARRAKLTGEIADAVLAMYLYWLPHRAAVHERKKAKASQPKQPKVGRNELCPCGSGKKFKRCCGTGGVIH